MPVRHVRGQEIVQGSPKPAWWGCVVLGIQRGHGSHWASLMAPTVKNLLAMQEMLETRVHSWGQEDPLEEEMAAHSSILAWRISQTKEPAGLQSTGLQEPDTMEHMLYTMEHMLYDTTVKTSI